MSKPNNPPAFPVPPCPIKEEGHSCSYDDERGITTRDYFAAKVLGHIALKDAMMKDTFEGAARTAYIYADAMLAEREKEV